MESRFMPIEAKTVRPPRPQSCVATQLLLGVVAGFMAIASCGPHAGVGFYIFLATSVVCFLALILGWGWLIPCLILGIVVGVISDPPVKGGTIESQMQETCTHIGFGTFLGLLVGLGADVASTACEKKPSDR